MAAIKILPTGTGIDVESDDARVRVDASAQTWRLDDGQRVVEFGAVSAGALDAIAVIAGVLGRPVTDDQLVPLWESLRRALASQADLKGLRDPGLEAQIAAIHPTPLLYAAPFLAARFLRDDARRFHACRVAIAHGEDDLVDASGPEAAAAVVEKLQRWRDLFAKGGTAKRALNAALNDFGDVLPAEALWGLRQVALGRPRQRRDALEILGWLGALAHADGDAALARIVALVEQADEDELMVAVDPGTGPALSPRAAALFLARGDPSSTTVNQLGRSARERDRVEGDKPRAFVRPPIPLPDVEGLRFIATGRDLFAESARMHHCVHGLMTSCHQGRAFIFHAERGGTHGTIHVNDSGRVVEHRGAFNHPSLAAAWGAEVLTTWGAAFWTGQHDPGRATWPLHLAVPEGARPLRSVKAVIDAWQTLLRQRPDERVRVSSWFRDAVKSAVAGGVGLFLRPHDDRVWVRTADGFDVGHCDVVTAPKAVVVPAHGRREARLIHVQRQPGGWLPDPPIPAPVRQDLRLLRREVELVEIGGSLADLARFAAHARDGTRFYLRCTVPARQGGPEEAVFVEVDRAGALQIVGRGPATVARQEQALALARRWTGGLWAGRLGLDRTTWGGDRRVPLGGEALTTVGACFLVYRSTCEKRDDDDGALARFYARHVEAATAGRAWLVARDRATGAVTVLDRRGAVVARSDDILGEGGVDTSGPERPR